MIVVVALPTALLCLLMAWMCLRRGYRRHAVTLALFAAGVSVLAATVVALCWVFWVRIAVHFT